MIAADTAFVQGKIWKAIEGIFQTETGEAERHEHCAVVLHEAFAFTHRQLLHGPKWRDRKTAVAHDVRVAAAAISRAHIVDDMADIIAVCMHIPATKRSAEKRVDMLVRLLAADSGAAP